MLMKMRSIVIRLGTFVSAFTMSRPCAAIKCALLALPIICPIWAQAQLPTVGWPDYRGSYGNTGTSTASGGFGNRRWSYTLPYDSTTVPITGPDGNIYFGDIDGYVYQVNPKTGAKNWSVQSPLQAQVHGQISGIAVASNGKEYASSYSGVFAIKVSNGSPTITSTFQATGSFTTPPVIGPDGTIYAQAGNALYALSPTTPGFVLGWPAWCRKSNFILLNEKTAPDDSIRFENIVDLRNGKSVYRMKGAPVDGETLSRDGHRFVLDLNPRATSEADEFSIWDTRQNREIDRISSTPDKKVWLSASGRLLAYKSYGGDLVVRNIDMRREVVHIPHAIAEKPVNIEIAPDDLSVGNAASGEQLTEFRASTLPIDSVVFTSDGKSLITAGQLGVDGTVLQLRKTRSIRLE